MAIKMGSCQNEIDMYLSVGNHDNVLGLRGLTQKVRGDRVPFSPPPANCVETQKNVVLKP